MSGVLVAVSDAQWIIEGWAMTRTQALAACRDYLLTERGVDEWDIDEAMARVRIDRTWYSNTAGFVYADYQPDGRKVLIVTGMPRIGPEPDSLGEAS